MISALHSTKNGSRHAVSKAIIFRATYGERSTRLLVPWNLFAAKRVNRVIGDLGHSVSLAPILTKGVSPAYEAS